MFVVCSLDVTFASAVPITIGPFLYLCLRYYMPRSCERRAREGTRRKIIDGGHETFGAMRLVKSFRARGRTKPNVFDGGRQR